MWSEAFQVIMDNMDIVSAKTGDTNAEQGVVSLLHALSLILMNYDDCLVWITSVPGGNIFGSQVIMVNDRVLQELQWSFSEWENGVAPSSVFRTPEANRIKLHLDAKSSIPVLAHVRKKNTPQNQEGQDYVFYFHYGLPYNLRLTVAVPT